MGKGATTEAAVASPVTKNVYQDGTHSSCGRSQFGKHAFAGIGSGPKVYDATMKGNAESNKDTTVKFPSPDGKAQSSDLTATVLKDAAQSWAEDKWIGCKLNPNANETTPDPYKTYEITDNTATTITVETGDDMTTDAKTGDYYEIFDSNNPVFTAEWFTGIPWSNYKPKAIDTGQSGAVGSPNTFSFSIE